MSILASACDIVCFIRSKLQILTERVQIQQSFSGEVALERHSQDIMIVRNPF